ncbi:MAG: ABC transporter substrate-binding protein, partial [Acidobacteriota bacterium]
VIGCADDATVQRTTAPPEIRLGLVVEHPSPISTLVLDATKLAVSQFNADGGIVVDGTRRPVTLVVEEADSTPEGATQASFELINQQKVMAIIGPTYSRNAIPSGAVAEKAGVPMVCPGPSHSQATAGRRFVFRVTHTNSYQARAVARFARQKLGVKTVAVLFDVAEAYSREIEQVFEPAFEALGGEVIAVESFTTGEQDFRPQLERIRAADPDAILLPNFRDEVFFQVEQARELGIDAVLLGTDSWPVTGPLDGRGLEGSFLALAWHRDLAAVIPAAADFVARFSDVYDIEPDDGAALTYDAARLLLSAIEAAASVEPEAIREQLAQIEGYLGASGTITYLGTEGDPRRSVVIGQYQAGEIRLVDRIEPEPSADRDQPQ